MTLKSHLLSYVNFNLWANTQMTDWLLSKESKLMTTTVSSSFPTIIKTLEHIWVAECIWMKRIQGEPFQNLLETCVGKDTKFIAEILLNQSKDYITFLNDLADASLNDVISYTLLSKDTGSATIAFILQHVVNHGSYHRGQLVTMGRELGLIDPPKTDYMEYVRKFAERANE